VTASTLSIQRANLPTWWLLLLAAVAWVAVGLLARTMGAMAGTMGLSLAAFTVVWLLMMTAMMLPGIVPFTALYIRTFTEHRSRRIAALTSGYLLVWVVAAVPAYALAWLAGRLLAGRQTAATALAAAIFLTCGVYQLTPMKDRCLAACRSPLGLVLKYGGRVGRLRDLRAGLEHGLFCLGCCWALMTVLVAAGLMNVLFMATLTLVVLAEKTWKWGPRLARLVGVAALLLAVAVVLRPALAPGLYQEPIPMAPSAPMMTG
jgi:predicted metal-binding membrane protein